MSGRSVTSELRKIPDPNQADWLDEAAAAALAREVLEAARDGGKDAVASAKVLLHRDAHDLLDVHQDHSGLFVEHWLIMGIWVITILASTWRMLF